MRFVLYIHALQLVIIKDLGVRSMSPGHLSFSKLLMMSSDYNLY